MYCYCLVSVRAARSLGIWERLLAASRPDSSPFLAMSSAACCSRTSQRRLVWPTEWYHSNGLWRDKLLKWWWSSTCIFDLRVSNEIILWLRYIYLIPVWIPRWSTRLHNSQTTNRRPCCNNSRVFYVNRAVAAIPYAQPFDYVVYLMFLRRWIYVTVHSSLYVVPSTTFTFMELRLRCNCGGT